MTDNENKTCSALTEDVKDYLKFHFDSVVPKGKQSIFTTCAMNKFPEEWKEVEALRSALASPTDVQSHNLNCTFYKKKYSKLIRAVAFELARFEK